MYSSPDIPKCTEIQLSSVTMQNHYLAMPVTLGAKVFA